MKKLKMLTLLTICCFIAGLTVVSAQSVVSQQQIDAKLEHNKSYDQKKLDMLKSQTNQGISNDDMKFNQMSQDAAGLQVKKDTRLLQNQNGGYLSIPGFTATGDPAVDGPAYEAAKAAYKQNDPQGYEQLLQLNQN